MNLAILSMKLRALVMINESNYMLYIMTGLFAGLHH
jgi:hypothetical protein